MRVRLGKVMLTPRGAYNNSTSYDFLDVVYKDASSYVSLSYENTGHNVTDTNYWQPLVDGAYIETYFDSRFIKRLSLTVPQGMSVTGSPVTAPEGTLAITLDNGYALLDSLTSSKINVAYNMRHTHTNLDLLNQITAARMAHWDAGGGGGGGGTTTEYDARYVKIEWFTQLFKAMDSSNNSLSVNGALTNFASIQATKNFWSQGGVSALGTGSSGGGGGGGEGVPLNQLLENLNNSTLGGTLPAGNEGKVLGYTSNGWAFVTPSSGGSSTLEGLTDTIISSPASGQVLTYNGTKWVNSAAPSSTDLAAVWASLSGTGDSYAATTIHANHIPDLSGTYLPKAGGTVTGDLTVNGTLTGGIVHIRQGGYFENYNLGKFYLPSGNGEYTLATTDDLDNYVSKDFINRLFQAFNGTTRVYPNDTTTTIDNIKAMADFWSAGAVAALGTSSGSGGTGVNLNSPLAEINQLNSNPSNGNILIYDGGQWGYRTLASITGGYVPTTRTVTAGNGLTGGGALSSDITIALSPSILADIANGVTAYGWRNHAEAGYAADNAVVHKDYAEEIIGVKTFSARLNANNDIYLGKTNQQQWIDFNNGLKHFDFGQEGSNGDCVLFSPDSLNFYTNVNNNPYALYVQGSSGNVGIGVDLSSIPSTSPSYKLRVNGDAYASGRMWSGLSIGAKTSETEGFRFEWDANNNAVVVVKADGTPCNFYSMGGVSALGVGAAGSTPSISAMNIASLTATTATAATLNVSTIKSKTVGYGPEIPTPEDPNNPNDNYYVAFNYERRGEDNHYMTDFFNVGIFGEDDNGETWSIDTDGSAVFASENVGTLNAGSMKVGSSGSSISRIKWDATNNLLEVVIAGHTCKFQPVSIN